jgi:putative transposase
MARIARIVVPGVPHYVTQRGTGGLEVFFGDEDYGAYVELLAESCAEARTACWAYCLMPDQLHLILVPKHEDGLRAALGETHRRYTRRINQRENWYGHLWQERFHSFPMDKAWLGPGARYIELSPVKAGLVRRARDWRWSSARAHLAGESDSLVKAAPLLKRLGDWRGLLAARRGAAATAEEAAATARLERHGRTGRPLGGAAFISRLETLTGRRLKPGKPGRPRKAPPDKPKPRSRPRSRSRAG